MSGANTADPAARTEPARRKFLNRFDAQVPAEVMDPAERARRAEHLKQAYFTALALKSARARRAKAAGDSADADVMKRAN
jgi:hypothetical protein